MRGLALYWICSISTFLLSVNLAFGDSNPAAPPVSNTGPVANLNANAQTPFAYDYAKLLEEMGAKRLIQQLVQLQQLQMIQQQKQMHSQSPVAQIPSPYATYIDPNFVPNTNFEPITKRSPHQIQQRAVMNQFKNCYFSPVQCVLLNKRGGYSSFA